MNKFRNNLSRRFWIDFVLMLVLLLVVVLRLGRPWEYVLIGICVLYTVVSIILAKRRKTQEDEDPETSGDRDPWEQQ